MIAVDTNCIGPHSRQRSRPARPSGCRSGTGQCVPAGLWPLVVHVETLGVLESGYGFPKTSLIQVLEHLQMNQVFSLEDEALCYRALELYRSSSADYADGLILSACRTKELRLHTFDKRLSRLAGAALVKADDRL